MTARFLLVLLFSLLVTSAAAADSDWARLRVPGFWEKEYGGTLQAYDGYAWYRCFVKVPGEWKGTPLSLELGLIDDCDETFFNGVRVGAMGSLKPYRTASGLSL